MTEKEKKLSVGVLRESFPGEKRVALIPIGAETLVKAGFRVLLEGGAGLKAGFPDREYEKRGVEILPNRESVCSQADILLAVRAAGANPDGWPHEVKDLREGQILIGFLEPLTARQPIEELANRGVTAFAVELVPRITRAQSMDALSSMATVAGYRAVLLAANFLPKMFPMLTTAAGTITPSRVLVIGAGVAGLQAIATARRLGAVVSGYDIRPAAREQVESLGAKFVVLGLETDEAEAEGGYARAMGEDFYRRQRELLGKVAAENDVVICTAAVPGKKAPLLITAESVRAMRPGSVIVDLAAERGGNCELTQPGRVVVEKGVTILGPVNLPSDIPYHASQMYSKNLCQFILHLVKNGKPDLDSEDRILKETLVTHRGKIVNPRVRKALGITEEGKDSASRGGHD